MNPTWSIVIALVLNFLLGGAAFWLGAVDLSGLAVGLIIGGSVAICLGLPGFALLALMFLIGSGATRWGYTRKTREGIAQQSGGRRGWLHAAANCIVPVACAVLAALDLAFGSEMMKLAFAAALATAAMDTASSELGPLYGRVTVLPPTFRRVKPGTDGAVSLEGTLLGLVAAAVMTAAAWALGLLPEGSWWVVPVSAVIATTVETLLGSAGLGKTPVQSAALNLVNTTTGASCAMVLCYCMI